MRRIGRGTFCGLGNQLYEISALYCLSKELGIECFFEEGQINASHSISHDAYIRRIIYDNFPIGTFDWERPVVCWTFEPEYYDSFMDWASKTSCNIRISGWNGPPADIMEKYKEDLWNIFSILVPHTIDTETLGLHFRCGDYIFYGMENLIFTGPLLGQLITWAFKNRCPQKVKVYTESPNRWERILEESNNYTPYKGCFEFELVVKNDLETFFDMASHKYFIPSISTFSDWSVFLGNAAQSNRVICPIREVRNRFLSGFVPS
jgi:hypothetical protein